MIEAGISIMLTFIVSFLSLRVRSLRLRIFAIHLPTHLSP